MKREVPLIITFVAGAVMIVQFYTLPLSWLGDLFNDFFNIIVTCAYVLGAASLLIANGRKIQRQAPGWGYNAVLLLSLLATLFCGFCIFPQGGLPTDAGTPFDWIFQNVYTPMSAATYSLLAFYIASASYRAFRARSAEATILLVTAFMVMLFRIPLGELLWEQLPILHYLDIGDFIETWIIGGFNTAGQRAIMLGASVGLISVSLKILLGIERSYLGSAD
ncbi:hypothetical protein IJT17_05170 [bacterium]|nr:hypothetical protein [bacterium]